MADKNRISARSARWVAVALGAGYLAAASAQPAAAQGKLEAQYDASLAGINVGKVGSNLSIVGCADLLDNGQTQMVMQQDKEFLAVHLQCKDEQSQRPIGRGDWQQLSRCRLRPARHCGSGRNADAGCGRRFGGVFLQC